MITRIYALLDEHGEFRYVGKTGKAISVRLRAHIKEARKGVQTYKCNWIRSMLECGLSPTVVLIEEVAGYGVEREMFWIAHHRKVGARLTNLTDGGDGLCGYRPSEETLVKLRARRHSAETKRKIREANLGTRRPHSDETREKIRKARTGTTLSEGTRAKLRAANVGKTLSAEHRRKLSAAQRRRWGG